MRMRRPWEPVTGWCYSKDMEWTKLIDGKRLEYVYTWCTNVVYAAGHLLSSQAVSGVAVLTRTGSCVYTRGCLHKYQQQGSA